MRLICRVVTTTFHLEYIYLGLIARLHSQPVQAWTSFTEPSELAQLSHRRRKHVIEPREPPGSGEVQPDANQPRDGHLWLEPVLG